MICRKCGKEFDPRELPASLRNKLKRCRECYLKTKKVSDELWYQARGISKKQYEANLADLRIAQKLQSQSPGGFPHIEQSYIDKMERLKKLFDIEG